MTDIVLTEIKEGITTVTLNRPQHLNALSVELRQNLGEVFIKLRNDAETQVIILTGNGRAFTSGLDLKELGQQGMNTPSPGNETVDLQKAIREVGKPVIGAINGFAITGGFELALACDILIASTEAKFADTHVRMGVVPGWGLSQRLSRLIGASRAKQLSFTGNYLSAKTAERWGLVNEVLEPDELLPYCEKLAKDITSVNQDTLKEVHRLIDYGWENSLAEGLDEERNTSRGKNRGLEAETLEQNRLNVQSRGREINS
ncbi:enoyl-CoA hydratase [Gammaproteobacteria bacterium]|jgi:enoyl-CoA hydratase|nr:enoyl-CoA hydratase [Gammaproteobacteria bacterium]